MGNLTTKIIAVILAICSMEVVAWLSHKYLMHGPLWSLHRDHHKKEPNGFFEHNDFFFLIFAIPGIVALLWGIHNGYNYLFWIGLGICFYGLMYFLVHDVFIHQRIKIFRNADSVYLKAIRRAHKMHHKHLDKENGECFGMLWVPIKYFREMKSKKKNEIIISAR
jgi:beta-carotene 3-hydroxylase